MTDERADTGVVQPFETVDELSLSTKAAVGAVVYVARDKERIHSLGDTEVDDVLVRGERRTVESFCDVFRGSRLQAREGTVEMQVSSMYEAESGHFPEHF